MHVQTGRLSGIHAQAQRFATALRRSFTSALSGSGGSDEFTPSSTNSTTGGTIPANFSYIPPALEARSISFGNLTRPRSNLLYSPSGSSVFSALNSNNSVNLTGVTVPLLPPTTGPVQCTSVTCPGYGLVASTNGSEPTFAFGIDLEVDLNLDFHFWGTLPAIHLNVFSKRRLMSLIRVEATSIPFKTIPTFLGGPTDDFRYTTAARLGIRFVSEDERRLMNELSNFRSIEDLGIIISGMWDVSDVRNSLSEFRVILWPVVF